MLFYHHWTAGGPDGWWGPPKRLVERAPWVLGLDYWPGCEALKEPSSRTVMTGDAVLPLAPAGSLPVVGWRVTGPSLSAGNAGGAHGAQWPDDSADPDGAAGRIIETGIRVEAGRGAGLWVRYRDTPSMFVVSLNAESRQVELGTVTSISDGSSLNLSLEDVVDFPLAAEVTYQARLLVRHKFAELYLDDMLVKSFACQGELLPSAHGFYSDMADAVFEAPARWLMTA